MKNSNSPELIRLLTLLSATKPWGRGKLSKRVAAYLDGESGEIVGAPKLTEMFNNALSDFKKVS